MPEEEDEMQAAKETPNVSIRYTLTLEDGTLLSHDAGGDRLDFTHGRGQILAAVEEALQGAVQGEKREIVLSPLDDPALNLGVSRLAQTLGHPGKTLLLRIEVL